MNEEQRDLVIRACRGLRLGALVSGAAFVAVVSLERYAGGSFLQVVEDVVAEYLVLILVLVAIAIGASWVGTLLQRRRG